MIEPLPTFRYHPDPIATGSVRVSQDECLCCGLARGFLYFGPVYAGDGLNESLCPWCIADGSAANRFSAKFTDRAGVGDYGRWPSVPDAVLDEVTMRTPGFSGWQQERWFTCCGDAALFLGSVGREELERHGPEAIRAIQAECGLSGTEWEGYLRALASDVSPTAYLFRCRHCGRLGGYSDCE